MLVDFRPHQVIHPKIEDLKPKKKSWFSNMFASQAPRVILSIPENLPKGIYMYGDVGSGKTMMMDLFFDTLPPHIKQKNRIHFHNFMQDVHRRLHRFTMEHGSDTDAIPFVAADIAEGSSVLAFDEFQCTDVADAMILRRLMESLMHHGCVIVTTSNRHPDELYKNGIQRESFIPCINLLKAQLKVLNLDSPTDYRKIPRPPSGVYHHPLDKAADTHAQKWFQFFADLENDPPHPAVHYVWGREIKVPTASGKAARFTFHDLIGSATGAADYIELTKHYEAFIITDVPGMSFRQRDWARRFITFIDAVYESHAKLVMTTEVPLGQLFMSRDEIQDAMQGARSDATPSSPAKKKILEREGEDLDDSMRMLMDDLGMNMTTLKSSSIFSGDEERFAFARALSRLSEMGSTDWTERGMGLEHKGGKQEKEQWEEMRRETLETMEVESSRSGSSPRHGRGTYDERA